MMSKRKILLFLSTALFLWFFTQTGWADQVKRIALVIGNASYKDASLKNPVNDAEDIAAVLKAKGFRIILSTNASRRTMIKKIRDFDNMLHRNSVGLFFYAGHGLQVKGSNYIVPVDANIEEEYEVESECIDVSRVLGLMEDKRNVLNIIILDACRDNPFARSFRTRQIRNKSRGLAQMNAPRGSLIVYATSPGNTASDGTKRNGIFTGQLIKVIKDQNLEILQLLKKVGKLVREETNDRQVPWNSSSLTDDFYFSEKGTAGQGWLQWLASFQAAVTEVKKIDGDKTLSPAFKIKRWRGVGKDYNKNHPGSKQDEVLQKYIKDRINYWQDFKAPESVLKKNKQKLSGFLRVVARPYAELTVDGIFMGEVPPLRTLKLTAGKHNIVLKKDGKTYRKTINIIAGKTEKLFHTFKKK